MAYSPIEESYMNGFVATQFETPVEPEPMQLADSGQVKSDAQAGYGSIGTIPRNKAQEALGYVGELLSKAGVELDKVGLDIPALGRITLKDLTVGESGKVLEDMSYGFMPVEGAGGFISGTTRIKPDAALELLNIAPTVGAAAKIAGKSAIKGVVKAVESTKGLPVGMSIKAANAKEFSDAIKGEVKGLELDLYESSNGNKLVLSKIALPKEDRKSGIGTDVMNEVIKFADSQDKTVALSPSTDFGGTSVARLKDFYKQFGFVENKGKNKDLSISETMYRLPVKESK